MQNIKTGCNVTTSLDDHQQVWCVTGKHNGKIKLVKPGLPNVVVIVSADTIRCVGPWR